MCGGIGEGDGCVGGIGEGDGCVGGIGEGGAMESVSGT